MTLYDRLKTYGASDAYPFHMPGHKRRAAFLCDPARIDITEIDGFDDLHHAEGILLEAEERAAALYGSSETHFLVNGSTAGVLSAIGACTRPGSLLLMARGSHRSAFHAAALNRVRTAYLYPAQTGLPSDLNQPVDPAQADLALDRLPDVSAVFLTSPTYDGVVSDVDAIAKIAHRHGIPLIVDEAHGAHYGMHPLFPRSSVQCGADLVIHSLHKTLPALTQTALIHVNGDLVDRARLRRLLSVYQTSSPSYVLMASIDQCIHLLAEAGPSLFDAFSNRLRVFYKETKLSHLSFLHTDDPSRILVHPPAGGAMWLYHSLRERFHLQPEMVTPSYVLMLSSVCDDDEGFSRLSRALRTLDQEYTVAAGAASAPAQACTDAIPARPQEPADAASAPAQACTDAIPARPLSYPEVYCTIAQALDEESEAVSFSSSEGRVSAEFLMLYPPGVPMLLPGEVISAEIISRALSLKEKGYTLQGTDDYSLRQIRVLSPGCRASSTG